MLEINNLDVMRPNSFIKNKMYFKNRFKSRKNSTSETTFIIDNIANE